MQNKTGAQGGPPQPAWLHQPALPSEQFEDDGQEEEGGAPSWAVDRPCERCGSMIPRRKREGYEACDDVFAWMLTPRVCGACERLALLQKRAEDAGIPPRYMRFSLERVLQRGSGEALEQFRTRVKGDTSRPLGLTTHNRTLRQSLQAWQPSSRSFWLVGPWGTGKTLHAAALAQDRIALGESVIWLTERDLWGAFLDREKRKGLKDCLSDADLIVLDEVGTQAPTLEWQVAAYEEAISIRYDTGRDLLITSNVEVAEWLSAHRAKTPLIGGRVASRLVEMLNGEQHYLGGFDWRTGREYEAATLEGTQLDLHL